MKPHSTFSDSQKHVLQTHSPICAVPVLVMLIRFRLCVLLVLASAFSLKTVAQAPVITSFYPASGAVGTTVTITGSNFNSNAGSNIVYFGAVRGTVVTASSTSLTVTVPVGATYQPISVIVNGLTAYSALPFNVTFPIAVNGFSPNSFGSGGAFPTGVAPVGIAIADIDGNGKPDLAMLNAGSNTVSVLRNLSSNGTTAFANKVDLPVGSGPSHIVAGDLDADGKLDIVVTNYDGSSVSVLRNTSSSGIISFASKVDFQTGAGAHGVAIGDLDGDGKPDIAVTNTVAKTLSILRNTSSIGTIAFESKVDYQTGPSPSNLAIGDLDGDDKNDIVASELPNKIFAMHNVSSNGTLGFKRSDYVVGENPSRLVLGDLNGDNKLDIAVVNGNTNTLSVLRNLSSSGTIALESKVDYQTEPTPVSLAIGDIDGDGKPDLVVGNLNSADSGFSVLRNISSDGTIALSSKVSFGSRLSPLDLAVGDVNSDSKPDITATSVNQNYAFIYINQLPNTCTAPTFRNDATIVLDASCTSNDGLISLIPTSGTAPFMYSIDGGATYVDGPAAGYSFMNLAPGTYQLRLKDAGGCESAIITREVRKFYGGPLFRNDGTIVLDASCGANDGNISIIPTCGAAPFQYSIDGGVTYVEGPATGYTFQNLAPGTYQLRLKDAYGTESAIVTREVRKDYYGPCATIATARPAARGAQAKEGVATLQAYPNPSQGRFQVQLGRINAPRVQLQVVDARGTVLQQRTLNGEQTSVVEVDLAGKAKGLYLIRVVSDKGTQQTKVLIQ